MTENRKPFDELRVIGSPQGFAVYDSARRKLSVHALDLFIRPGNPPLMQIAMPAGNIDVVGKPLFAVVDPSSGKPRVVKRIEWADGHATDFPDPEKVQSMFNKPKPEQAAQDGPEIADELGPHSTPAGAPAGQFGNSGAGGAADAQNSSAAIPGPNGRGAA